MTMHYITKIQAVEDFNDYFIYSKKSVTKASQKLAQTICKNMQQEGAKCLR
jgi:hypothetical protein